MEKFSTMDGSQFDVLTRSIAKRLSRRFTFKALTAGLAAGALSQIEVEPADAARCQAPGKSCRKRRGKPRPKCCGGSVCRGNRCQCKGGRKQCGNKCITRKQCCRNKDCANNQVCNNNRCRCRNGRKLCQGACIANSQCCAADCATGACTCKPGTWPNIATGTCQTEVFSNDLQTNLDGWYDFQDTNTNNDYVNMLYPPETAIELGTGGAVVQPRNAYRPRHEKTAMTTLGGFNDVFPEGGFDVSLDIFLDPENTPALQHVSYSAGINRGDCSSWSDLIFVAGTSAAGDALCVYGDTGAHNNDAFDACGLADSVEVPGAGWYTFRQEFRADGDNILVTMTVTAEGGDEIFSNTVPEAVPAGAERGGNRYAWFPYNNISNGVLIRNLVRTNNPG